MHRRSFQLPLHVPLKQGYIELGVPSEQAYDGILTRDQLKEMTRILRLSMFQMEYEDDTPVPKDVTITRAQVKGIRGDLDFIVSVKLPDTTVGFLSLRPDRIAAIPVNRLSAAMTSLIRKNPTLVGV
jgi:hypothetical protein